MGQIKEEGNAYKSNHHADSQLSWRIDHPCSQVGKYQQDRAQYGGHRNNEPIIDANEPAGNMRNHEANKTD
ncbi:hypothetical protein D3C71_2176400 [compost metagenome]